MMVKLGFNGGLWGSIGPLSEGAAQTLTLPALALRPEQAIDAANSAWGWLIVAVGPLRKYRPALSASSHIAIYGFGYPLGSTQEESPFAPRLFAMQ